MEALPRVEGLTIGSVSTTAIRVPLRFPLGTSAAVVRAAPILLVDLQTREGPVGRSYLFTYTASGARAIAGHLAEAVGLVASEPVAPRDIQRKLNRRYALLGVTGTVRLALSALDVALWDALGKAAGLPIARMLGAAPRPMPAYNSNGLGLMAPEAAADEAEQLLEGGFRAVKLRLGYPTLAGDLAVTRAVRKRLPDQVALMVDYNQALTLAEALIRGRALQDEGLAWLEEPVRWDDYAGSAAIARELHLPVQTGENFNGPEGMADAVAAGVSDYVMPDVMRIGGVTGWIDAAGIAAGRGIPMSSHLQPEISAPLLAATPTAHFVEYVDWGNAFLDEPAAVRDGQVVVTDRPGFGIAWDDARVRQLTLA